jgi:hypothetical protein
MRATADDTAGLESSEAGFQPSISQEVLPADHRSDGGGQTDNAARGGLLEEQANGPGIV